MRNLYLRPVEYLAQNHSDPYSQVSPSSKATCAGGRAHQHSRPRGPSSGDGGESLTSVGLRRLLLSRCIHLFYVCGLVGFPKLKVQTMAHPRPSFGGAFSIKAEAVLVLGYKCYGAITGSLRYSDSPAKVLFSLELLGFVTTGSRILLNEGGVKLLNRIIVGG